MAYLSDEETRALEFNLRMKRRLIATKAREITLQGNLGAAKDLSLDMQALKREETNDQKQKVRYDGRVDSALEDSGGSDKGRTTVNG